MKKLNKKGFTLIELLAVIVILAIVMVVTIPSVLNSMEGARANQLQNAANTVAEWFQKNYDLTTLSSDFGAQVEAAYTTFGGLSTTAKDLDSPVLKAAGLGGGLDDVTGKVKLVNGSTTSKKVCVTLTAKSTGKFKGAGSKTNDGCTTVS